MHLTPNALALLMIASASLGPANAEQLSWYTSKRANEIVLAYGEANTDNVTLLVACDLATGRVRVTPSLEAVGLSEGETGAILLSGPSGTVTVSGVAVLNDMTGGVELWGDAPSAKDVIQALGKAGRLTLAVPGRSESLPLGRAATAALAVFRRRCPSAR